MNISDKLIREYQPKVKENCRMVGHLSRTFDRNGLGNGFEYIHPMFQEYINTILGRMDEAKEYVKELWIFGSAITWMVHLNSDLDCMVIIDGIDYREEEGRNVINEISEWARIEGVEQDLLIETSSDFNKCKEVPGLVDFFVMRNGFKIWERGD